MESSGIYVIRNLNNGKVYVGSTKNFYNRKATHFKLLRKNKHWNIKLQRSFNAHGENAFTFEIIERVPYEKEIIIERENFFIHSFNAKNNGYNIADASFGNCLSNHPFKEEIIKKISKGLKESFSKLTLDERKEKFGRPGEKNGMFGLNHSEESKQKMKEVKRANFELLGYGPTKGCKASKEHRQKISEFAKTRTGEKNAFYGKEHSKETKRKISLANKGKPCANAKKIIVDGVEYNNCGEAEKTTGIKASTLYFRANSNNPKFCNIYFKEKPKMKINDLVKGNRVFLGGTCNDSTWRETLKPLLKIEFFDPVVKDWNEEAYKRELHERETCDYCLYVITPKMTGVYSIAEVVDDSNKRPEKTVFCVVAEKEDNEFSKSQSKSLDAVKKMVKNNGGNVFDTLEDVANFLNGDSK